jgi:hypothetical protein
LVSAVQEFIAALGETPQTEYLAVVSYASNGTYCSGSNSRTSIDQALGSNHGLAQAAVNAISNRVFNGNTAISPGIDQGVEVLTDTSRARPFAAKTIVLLTDGYPTEGRPTIEAAQDAAAEGIVIHTVTFGAGSSRAEMQAVADATGGDCYHAPDAATLRQIFREIALTLPVIITE